MALKRPSILLNMPNPARIYTCLQCRSMHRLNAPVMTIPKPTPFVPDAQTFLTLIGRNMSQHAAKFPTWDALFTLTSDQLRESGVEPARARKYLLWWRERYRNGIMGIGGDLKNVKDGIAELRIVEVPSTRPMDQAATLTKSAAMRKVIMNVEPTVALPVDPAAAPVEGKEAPVAVNLTEYDLAKATEAKGFRIIQGSTIGGTGIEAVKGYQGVAMLKIQDGLWEQRRGHKVDGGERRKAEVRYKRRAQERKNSR
ncbi:Hypothetical protein R9X50_00385500 [Acrodontium crateriforme]|uniref:Small ribosomal subunit protein mS41 n=1 Tax=Acrodontium crateriforme TaxID=150365 RepID=A0AAQ3R9R7_9PEZI|nr:Hypothetical protein R9X50_00385500 [Acrodontium crateriforme]